MGRLLRPLRLLDRLEGMHVILKALADSMPDLLGVVFLQLVFFVMFSIIGMNLFTGKFYRCDDGDVYGRSDCVGTAVSSENGVVHAPYWENPGFSFDSLDSSMKVLFLVSTCSGWSEVMYVAMDVTTVDVQPKRDANPSASLFFVVFIFTCSFAIVNLFIGVLVHLFGVSSGRGLQTTAQRKWSLMKILVSQMRPTNIKIRRKKGFRGFVYDAVMHDAFDAFITLVIVFNVTTMMSNFVTEPGWWAGVIENTNMCCLTIFTVEMAVKNIGIGWKAYLRDPWNRVDGFVVIFSWGVFILNSGIMHHEVVPTGMTQVIRCMRVVRVMLLLKRAKGLRQVFSTFFISLPEVFEIAVLLSLVRSPRLSEPPGSLPVATNSRARRVVIAGYFLVRLLGDVHVWIHKTRPAVSLWVDG